MDIHSFKAEYQSGGVKCNFNLGVYIFKEGDVYISYCPALDISGYGKDEKEAKDSFGEVMKQYIMYCVEHGTLAEDLRGHGWKVKDNGNGLFKSPDTESMLKRNPDFKDLLDNKEYSRYIEDISIPLMA